MNDLPEDNFELDAKNEGNATATLDVDNVAETAQNAGPCCEKCGAPFKSSKVSVCRRCGWYARLNQYVDIDQDYEVFHDDAPAVETTPRPSHLQVWKSLLPAWSWVLIATFVVIVAESTAALYVTEADSDSRMWWSLGQLGIGLAAFVSCHVFNFLVQATRDADVGFLDVLIKPLALWLRALRSLPKRLWVTDGALAGATAVAMSIFVIGAIPYEAMFDSGVKRKKPNLLAAIVRQTHKMPAGNGSGSLADAVGGMPAGGSGGATSLEEAIGDAAAAAGEFDEASDADETGKAADKEGSNDASKDSGDPAKEDAVKDSADKKAEAAKPTNERKKIVCVILGYRLDSQHRISALVLGASHNDKLAYAGIVTTPPDDASLIDLTDDLERSRVAQANIPLYVDANWVYPKYVCQVNYHNREADGRLIDIQWEKLRGTLTQQIYARPAAPGSTGR